MDELDELQQGHNTWVRAIDIRDLSNPFVASTWTGPTRAIDHNGYTVGNNYYMSNYERGITVLDVTTPEDPQEIAFFDTFPSADDAAFHGAWGVYPFLPSGTILVSNIDGPGGLFILRHSPP
jgi:choice-of-anchor B domain-containing protein